MRNLRDPRLPLAHLEAFEAAGRLASFSRAGAELGMTQAAVSYAIRAIETSLGAPLFNRVHRGVELTEAGRAFLADVTLGLSHIRRSAAAISRRPRGRHVTLSCSTAFATWWLLPRLADLRRRFPGLELRVLTTDRDIDIAEAGIDLGVRYGTGVLLNYQRAAIAGEVIYPVASPGFLRRLGRDPASIAPRDFIELPLIHLVEPHRPCPDWPAWLRAMGQGGFARLPGLELNDYALVVQATLEGEGIALGWHHLVEPMLEKASLVRVGPREWATGVNFEVVWSGEPSPEAAAVRQWLTSAGQRGAAPAPPPALPPDEWPAPAA